MELGLPFSHVPGKSLAGNNISKYCYSQQSPALEEMCRRNRVSLMNQSATIWTAPPPKIHTIRPNPKGVALGDGTLGGD
jgi:hypothetical protein